MTRPDRLEVALRVDYDDANDLVSDYTENLSAGGICVANRRALGEGTVVRLALSFPGIVAPIHVVGVVRWARADGAEPLIGIELSGGDRDRLAAIVDRIRSGDPTIVRRALRVLVADDNPHVVQLIRDALVGRFAFHCTAANDGSEALACLRDQSFDVMIVEVNLPMVDGPHLISRIRGPLGLRDLRIIATSTDSELARRTALSAGADVFIAKPMRLRLVENTLRAIAKLDDLR